jgi:hypothetical protein
MQITQVITFLAVAIVGTVASPGGRQPPSPHSPPTRPAPPPTVVQQVFYGCYLLCYTILIPDLD